MRDKTGIRGVITIVAALSMLGSLAAPSAAYPRPGLSEIISVDSAGKLSEEPATASTSQYMQGPSVSASGRYVAFASYANNLDKDDRNLASDIFVRDRVKKTTTLVSIGMHGVPAAGTHPTIPSLSSFDPAISASGRYVAFKSYATNLVEGDTDAAADIFIFDRKSQTTELISVDGGEGDCSSSSTTSQVALSDDARFVAFSGARCVASIPVTTQQIFLRDRETKKTELISVGMDGEPANQFASKVSLSSNGRFVAFTSAASNLVPDDTNGITGGFTGGDVFVRDRKLGSTERVSVATDGSEGRAPSPLWAEFATEGTVVGLSRNGISDDGRFVTFRADYANLVPNDSNDRDLTQVRRAPTTTAMPDIFVHDRKLGRTERVSVNSWGQEANKQSTGTSISGDGRYVTFDSWATNFFEEPPAAPGLEGNFGKVYVHDRSSGALDEITVPYAERTKDCKSGVDESGRDEDDGLHGLTPDLNRNGRFVVFSTCNGYYFPGDTNNTYDVFLRDRGDSLGADQGATGDTLQSNPAPLICIAPDICLPPQGSAGRRDLVGEVDLALKELGSDLWGASVVHRYQLGDLWVTIELEYMPQVLPGLSPISYGLRFEVEDKSYEVRATSLNFGTFGLFDCTDSAVCTKVVDLRGGYGTTGMRVVFSLPLDEIGLENGGELKDVTAYSGLGTFITGPAEIFDQVKLK